MADFPALRPAVRRYGLGVYPASEERGFGGGSVRFLHGATASGHTLQLGFTVLTNAEAKLLRDHYREQQGGFLPFALSTEAWAGHTSQTDLVPSTTLWVYAAQPDETHLGGGLFDVNVQLASVI
jgi:hypothetical protein